jgi:replicative DNA helicase
MNIFEAALLPMQVWTKRADDRLADWQAGKVDGISTGFVTIDPYLRLVNSEYTLIAARPSMGKTSLAMQVAENVAKDLQKKGDAGIVAIFSAEMSGTELVIRMASAHSGVNAHALRNGYGKPADFATFREAINHLSGLPIWIDDSSGPTTTTMLQRLEELNAITPIRFMLFDFVELGGDAAPNEELRISSIHKHLKGIAKTLNIPVWGISQLNRDVDKRADKMPQLADLRYSGMAEQIADKVVFIMRPEYYIERQITMDVDPLDEKGVAYILVAKNRNGPVKMVKMAFIKENSKFGDLKRTDLNDY